MDYKLSSPWGNSPWQKLGDLWFTTVDRAPRFARLVLKDMRNTHAVEDYGRLLGEDGLSNYHSSDPPFILHCWVMEPTVKVFHVC
jgi:hypothetical protein